MNGAGRDYNIIGHGRDLANQVFLCLWGVATTYPLGIVVLKKSKHAPPGASDLLSFSKGTGNQVVKCADF